MSEEFDTLSSLCCMSFGVPFRLSAEDGPLLERMLSVAPLATELSPAHGGVAQQFTLSRGPDGGYCLSSGGNAISGVDLDMILEQLGRELMVHVANYAPDLVFMHAGVVAKNGHSLLLPGKSFAGKTTLVAELVRAGAIYYSDEYAVLDAQGRVHPYPRDLKMRQPGRPEQTAVPVETLHGHAGFEPLPVSMVIFAEYAHSAEWLPEPVSRGMAALEMLRHTIPVQRTPARVMATLAKMMETATAWRSLRDEADVVASALLAMMEPAEVLA